MIEAAKLCERMSKLADEAMQLTRLVQELPEADRYSPRVVAAASHMNSCFSAVFHVVWGACEDAGILRSWSVTVEPSTPSLNQVMRMHPMAHKKHCQDWMNLLNEANLKLGDRITRAKGIRTVQIIRNGSRLLDMDNLPGGYKHILDSIKKLGWIVDDSPDKTILISSQRKVGKNENPTTTVRITDGVPQGAAASLLI